MLDIADEIRQHPERWTQGDLARDEGGEFVPIFEDGRLCESTLPQVVACCALGFVYTRAPARYEMTCRNAFGQAVGTSLVSFNDVPGRKAQHVADAFESAAATLKERGL
jgi:hypothetical protein